MQQDNLTNKLQFTHFSLGPLVTPLTARLLRKTFHHPQTSLSCWSKRGALRNLPPPPCRMSDVIQVHLLGETQPPYPYYSITWKKQPNSLSIPLIYALLK